MNPKKLQQESLITSIAHIWTYSLGIIKDIFKLFTLEVRLAGKSLATILILVVIAALLLLSCWFGILGAIVAWLITHHMGLVLSLLLVSAVNLVAAIVLGICVIRISTNLQFKETRKQLDFMREDNETVTSKD